MQANENLQIAHFINFNHLQIFTTDADGEQYYQFGDPIPVSYAARSGVPPQSGKPPLFIRGHYPAFDPADGQGYDGQREMQPRLGKIRIPVVKMEDTIEIIGPAPSRSKRAKEPRESALKGYPYATSNNLVPSKIPVAGKIAKGSGPADVDMSLYVNYGNGPPNTNTFNVETSSLLDGRAIQKASRTTKYRSSRT